MQPSVPQIFNTALVSLRAARLNAARTEALHVAIAEHLADRIADIARPLPALAELVGYRAYAPHAVHTLTLDTQEYLSSVAAPMDGIVSALVLHRVNDVLGAMIQLRRALKPDGVLLCVLPGANTLRELRQVFAEVESELYGGISPRVSPFLEVRDAGNLLQRAGFALPVVDSDTVTLTYPSLRDCMRELRALGESNILHERRSHFTSRAFFAAAEARYKKRFGMADGKIPVTIELLTLTAWAPDASQPKPAARGSGKVSLKQFLE